MSVKKIKSGKWQVRWRDAAGVQRARNHDTKDAALDFNSKLDAARRGFAPEPEAAVVTGRPQTFREVVEAFKRRRYPAVQASTVEHYDKLFRLHIEPSPLMPLRITDVTPDSIDDWLDWLIARKDAHGKGALRTSFRQEMLLLSAVLNDYAEYNEKWTSPIKRRHRKRLRVGPKRARSLDMSPEEFVLMETWLRRLDYHRRGHILAALATVQFRQSLRISEPAALTWKNVRFDWAKPEKSRLVFDQHVIYMRKAPSFIAPGVKNDAMKEQPMLPETFMALADLWSPTARGLVFPDDDGQFFKYREVQHAYGLALKRAGLPYSATHFLRHGGTRTVFEETGGDRDIAAQQLGNRDDRSVATYAVRSAAAFTAYAAGKWDESASRSAFERCRVKLLK